MPANNPFESPRSEVTIAESAPTVSLSYRILRAVTLGLIGYAIYVGCLYLSARSFGSEGNLPATLWAFGIYTAMTFAGSELFANSQHRSGLRRLAYSMGTIFLTMILIGYLVQVILRNPYFPLRNLANSSDLAYETLRALLVGIFFVAMALTINNLRSRRKASQSKQSHEK